MELGSLMAWHNQNPLEIYGHNCKVNQDSRLACFSPETFSSRDAGLERQRDSTHQGCGFAKQGEAAREGGEDLRWVHNGIYDDGP